MVRKKQRKKERKKDREREGEREREKEGKSWMKMEKKGGRYLNGE